jgi:hypothetical protein
MGSVTPLAAPASPADDQPRELLRKAQVELGRARDAQRSHGAAIARAEELAKAAREKLATAESAVTSAKQRHADAIADSVVSGAPASSGVRAARAAVTDAADEVEAAEAAILTLRERQGDFLEDIKRAEYALIGARNTVIAAIAGELLEQARDAKARYFAGCEILKILIGNDRLPELANVVESLRLTGAARAPLAALEHEVDELLTNNRHLGGELARSYEAWRQQLLVDPDKPPPEFAA